MSRPGIAPCSSPVSNSSGGSPGSCAQARSTTSSFASNSRCRSAGGEVGLVPGAALTGASGGDAGDHPALRQLVEQVGALGDEQRVVDDERHDRQPEVGGAEQAREVGRHHEPVGVGLVVVEVLLAGVHRGEAVLVGVDRLLDAEVDRAGVVLRAGDPLAQEQGEVHPADPFVADVVAVKLD
jgi:hypothetical protein